jgi:hypothetical protein
MYSSSSFEVISTADQSPFETFVADGVHEPFGEGIGAGCSYRGSTCGFTPWRMNYRDAFRSWSRAVTAYEMGPQLRACRSALPVLPDAVQK